MSRIERMASPAVSLGERHIGLFLAIAISSCASSGNVRVTPTPGLEQRVTITVSRGLQPEFRWSPDSGIGWLHVGRHDKDQLVWEIFSGDTASSMRQPIRYGVPPAGARAKPAIPLEPGVEYELSVGRIEPYRSTTLITQIARVRFRAEEAPPK